MRDGRVTGRIAAILDRNFNRFQDEEAGFFGFFECVNDQEAATALLQAAREWLLARGARIMRGPVNPSTNYECGLLVDGFDSSPMVMMTYNPPYYAALLEGAGLRKAKDLWAWTSSTSSVAAEKALRVGDRALKIEGRDGAADQHEGFPGGRGKGVGSLQRRLGPQLGFRTHDARGVPAQRQGDEADPEAGTGPAWGSGRPGGGFRPGAARYQPGAQARRRQTISRSGYSKSCIING